MYKANHDQEVMREVKMIAPSEIFKMDKEDTVIVNRVRLNSRLVEFEIRNNGDTAKIIIIRNAIQDMKTKERQNRRALMGPEMTVEQVLQVFDDVEDLPGNSFALAEA